MLVAAGVSAAVARDMAEQAAQAQSNQAVQLANLRSEYDYIVVGAGAAGCVMAHRLSQNGQASVLVIEGGGTNLDQEKIYNPGDLHAEFRLRHRLGLQVDAAAGAQQSCHRRAGRQDHRRRLEHQRHGLAQGRQGRLRRLGGGGRSRLGLRGDHPQFQEDRAVRRRRDRDPRRRRHDRDAQARAGASGDACLRRLGGRPRQGRAHGHQQYRQCAATRPASRTSTST